MRTIADGINGGGHELNDNVSARARRDSVPCRTPCGKGVDCHSHSGALPAGLSASVSLCSYSLNDKKRARRARSAVRELLLRVHTTTNDSNKLNTYDLQAVGPMVCTLHADVVTIAANTANEQTGR